MAKFALIFAAVFLFVQLALCAEVRVKRDTAESSTQNILDTIKSGIETTFSEQNIKKAVDNLNEFGDTLKVLGEKVVQNFQNAIKKDEPTPEKSA